MAESPTFSIVIPSYNYGHFLTQTLESVLNQATGDVQIILVDDASTDNTEDIARNYESRILYIRNDKNLGAGGAWKVGLSHATGKFLIKLDADDQLLPGHLDAVKRAFESDQEVGLVVASVLVKKEGQKDLEVEYVTGEDQSLDSATLRKKFLHGFFFRMPGCALRSEIIQGHQSPDPELYQIHDWEFFLRVTKGHKAVLLRKPGGLYRIHRQSITATAQFNNRLFDDIERWLGIADEPGDRHLARDELRILHGSCAELLLIGFGPKFKPASYFRYAYKYYRAVGISMRGGICQVLRLHITLFGKIFKKILRRDRAERFQPAS